MDGKVFNERTQDSHVNLMKKKGDQIEEERLYAAQYGWGYRKNGDN